MGKRLAPACLAPSGRTCPRCGAETILCLLPAGHIGDHEHDSNNRCPPIRWAAQPLGTVLREAIEDGRDELTLDEARAFAEEQTQRYFRMSVEEFQRAVEAGVLAEEDHPMVVHVALLTGAKLHAAHPEDQ